MRKFVASVSLAALLATGCGEYGGGGSGGGASGEASGNARVDPERVDPAALKAAVSDERARRFYEKRGWAALWSEEQAEALTVALADAVRHGLDPKGFLEQARQGATAAEREAGLTIAALGYAQALATGVADPRKLWGDYSVPMNRADVSAGLAGAVERGEIGPWLAGLAPSDPEYRALSDAYLAYRQRAAGERRAPVATGGKIEVGDRDARVPAIAEALRANSYLPAAPPPPAPKAGRKAAPRPADSNLYTREIAAAAARLQADYGIEADGVIGNATLEALNTGAADRARILAVNLERRRWLERGAPATRIDVNTAAAHLDYWKDGSHAHRTRVVVGQPDWETPQLGSPIFRLVANPPWTVPESIAEEEILPKGAAYMARERIEMKNGRLVQAPGPKSALGLVKFDMDNAHQIYLHDTPHKALFGTTERHSSHGCARVEDALGFARLLAGHDGKAEAFEKALATGEETPVELSARIPVRLLYHSAYLDGGRVVFRTDPYGWDDRLAQALGFKGQLRQRVRTHVSDAGP